MCGEVSSFDPNAYMFPPGANPPPNTPERPWIWNRRLTRLSGN